MQSKGSLRATLYLISVILLWAATPLLVTELVEELPVFEVLALSTAAGAVVLALGSLARGGTGSFRRFTSREVLIMLAMGFAGIFPYNSLYYFGLSLAPAQAGSVNIANYLWPLWTVLLAVPVLKEPMTWRRLAGVLLAFAGVYLLISGGRLLPFASEGALGYLSAGSGAFFWGLFSVLTKRFRFEALPAMAVYSAGALIGFTGVSLILGGLRWPSPAGWVMLLLLGGAVNGLAYVLWTLALRHDETAWVSSLIYLVPFVALVYLFVFQGRPIRPLQLACLSLVVSGALLNRLRPGRLDQRRAINREK
jgi:drug/metabolite transporter (DMT)-like permease